VVISYHYLLRKNPAVRSSQLLRGGSLKPRRSIKVCAVQRDYSHILIILVTGVQMCPAVEKAQKCVCIFDNLSFSTTCIGLNIRLLHT
jgi:hypothetical protein